LTGGSRTTTMSARTKARCAVVRTPMATFEDGKRIYREKTIS